MSRSERVLLATMISCALLLDIVGVAPPAVRGAESPPLLPVADAPVYAQQPGVNFGANTGLRTDGSPLIHSYLRWDVTGSAGATQGLLRVYAETANLQGIELRRVADTGWGENAITFANAPSFGPILATSGPISAGSWISFDVTAQVTADAPISFALTSASATATRFSSREAPNAPQLVVRSGG